jgi:hypothetical protein
METIEQLTDEQELEARTVVRNRIRLCSDYLPLQKAALRFCASLYGKNSGRIAQQEQEFITEPERLLREHSHVMHARSQRCQTLRALADSVIAQAELPMHKPGKFRGEDYRVNLEAAYAKWCVSR